MKTYDLSNQHIHCQVIYDDSRRDKNHVCISIILVIDTGWVLSMICGELGIFKEKVHFQGILSIMCIVYSMY